MTAKILEFKRKPEKKPKLKSVKSKPALKTDLELFLDATEDVMGAWQLSASRDALNEYFISVIDLPLDPTNDYLNDLNALSEVERMLDMKVGMFYPGCTENNPHGWLASFHLRDALYTTPPHMVTEANARAMNILLYLHFVAIMKSLNR